MSAVTLGSWVLASCVVLGLTGCSRLEHRKPVRYILDSGATGWVKITYNRSDAPKLPVEDGHTVVRISSDLHVVTSSPMNSTWEGSEFYYRRPDGQLIKLSSEDNDQRRLWGLEKTSNRQGDREVFFVGRQQQFTQVYAATGDLGTGLLQEKAPEQDLHADFGSDLMKLDTAQHK